MADSVALIGGPFDGDADPVTGTALAAFVPAYFCASDRATGGWHHYVHTSVSGAERHEYRYAGPCGDVPAHPNCGRSHDRPERPDPPATRTELDDRHGHDQASESAA